MEKKPDIITNPFVVGHILIREKDTGLVLVNQRDKEIKDLNQISRKHIEEKGRND